MSDETRTEERHERRTVIAYPHKHQRGAGHEIVICYQCGEAWPCEIVRLRERVALLEDGATHAIAGLADVVCVHGAGFDSNVWPDWDNHCSVCAAMHPLAAALAGEGQA